MLNQNAVQEIYPAGADDVAVNFIILPEFFDYGLKMIEEEENLLRTFIIDCLRGENGTSGYLLAFQRDQKMHRQNIHRSGTGKAPESGCISASYNSHECHRYCHGSRI